MVKHDIVTSFALIINGASILNEKQLTDSLNIDHLDLMFLIHRESDATLYIRTKM